MNLDGLMKMFQTLQQDNGVQTVAEMAAERGVAPDLSSLGGGGFGEDTNIVSILSNDGNIRKLPKLFKSEVAKEIFNELGAAIKSKNTNAVAHA